MQDKHMKVVFYHSYADVSVTVGTMLVLVLEAAMLTVTCLALLKKNESKHAFKFFAKIKAIPLKENWDNAILGD